MELLLAKGHRDVIGIAVLHEEYVHMADIVLVVGYLEAFDEEYVAAFRLVHRLGIGLVVVPVVRPAECRLMVGNRNRIEAFHEGLHHPHARRHVAVAVDCVHMKIDLERGVAVDVGEVYLAGVEGAGRAILLLLDVLDIPLCWLGGDDISEQ